PTDAGPTDAAPAVDAAAPILQTIARDCPQVITFDSVSTAGPQTIQVELSATRIPPTVVVGHATCTAETSPYPVTVPVAQCAPAP
ncbi:MAG TPA: hypothetical protein VNO21_20645, partial [Polyangiaceae bacterium]|nr:hypothetical protein [Polyangiaceae bacterium]